MEPYQYLEKTAAVLETLNSREEINNLLDELEFLYEALEPEHQDLATQLIERLHSRLSSLS